MKRVVVCEKMGWTYDQYEDQPNFFIDLILEKQRIDVELAEREAKNRR